MKTSTILSKVKSWNKHHWTNKNCKTWKSPRIKVVSLRKRKNQQTNKNNSTWNKKSSAWNKKRRK